MRKILVLVLLCLVPREAAANVNPGQAVLAIIGEAENQGPRGMLAVACAIRNRGHLKGVYGLRAPRVVKKKYKPEILKAAIKAWEDSRRKDITKGADHWENVEQFGKPYWAKKYRPTVKIGSHQFYSSK